MESGFGELHGSYKDEVDYGECSDVDVLGGRNTNQKAGPLSPQNPMQCIIGGRAFQSVPTT